MSSADVNSGPGKYYNQILKHIKESISNDIRYNCTECGRLKNKDVELSGTLCPACESSNISLDPVLNRFTTLVKNMQLDIENKLGDQKGDKNIFIKPTVLSTKENFTIPPLVRKCKDKPKFIIPKINTQIIQTDLSFSPFDDVSFVIKRNDCTNQTNNLSKEIENESKNSEKSEKEPRNSEQINSDESSFQKPQPLDRISPEADVSCNGKVDTILTKSQEQFIETETEVIESSVDDFLLPRKTSSSPLLFSQDAKDVEMQDASSGENSDTECVVGTPPREFESTCTWRKEKDVSRCEKPGVENEIDDENLEDTHIQELGMEPMQTDNDHLNSTTIDTIEENKQNPSEETCTQGEEIDILQHETKQKGHKLTEEQLLTQNSQKFSKHNLKIVISNIEGPDYDHLERFIAMFNPLIDDDVTQDSNFLIVGVNSDNKVLRRTPKFLKAISLHVCIVNVDYVVRCVEAGDVVGLERRFIPFDSSGLNGPFRSCINPNMSLLGNFVFFSLEKDEYLSSLLEFIIIQNGGIIVPDIKLFKAYKKPDNLNKSGILSSSRAAGKLGTMDETGPQDGASFKKVLLYGDNEAAQFTEGYKLKVFTAYACHSLNYKCLFDCVASYDVTEMCSRPMRAIV